MARYWTDRAEGRTAYAIRDRQMHADYVVTRVTDLAEACRVVDLLNAAEAFRRSVAATRDALLDIGATLDGKEPTKC